MREIQASEAKTHLPRLLDAVETSEICNALMAFVLDASVSACRAFADENHMVADVAFSSLQTDEAAVPALWWFEVRNILVGNERRGRIHERDSSFFLRALAQ